MSTPGLTMMSVGDIMSTLGLFSKPGDNMSTLGVNTSTQEVYHDECSVGGYHEYTGGCSVHWRVIMSTLGGYQDACGGYHE